MVECGTRKRARMPDDLRLDCPIGFYFPPNGIIISSLVEQHKELGSGIAE